MLHQHQLPNLFWKEAVAYATYLKQGCSPYRITVMAVYFTGTLRLHSPINRTVLRHSKISNGTVQVKKRVYGRKYGIFKYYKVKSEIYRVQESRLCT
jgi:hypothetical protein